MKNGKVSQAVLDRSVFRQLHSSSPAVQEASSMGGDYAAARCDGGFCVCAMAQKDLPSRNQARRAVMTALNNTACSGAEAVGILVSLTVPTLWNEAQVREMMRDVDAAAAEWDVQVMGGHTTASRAVKNALLSVTAIGTVTGALLRTSDVKPGMDLVLTKWIGLDGTYLLAAERQESLRSRFSQPFLDKAMTYGERLSIRSEAAVAAKSGACAMHDLSEGGVFGALWEMAEASGVGLEIDLKAIPIRQETVEIAEFFDLNPYKLLSAGSLLIAAADGSRLIRELEKAGIPAAIIGVTTDSKDRVLLQDGERRFLEMVQTDEIYKVFSD